MAALIRVRALALYGVECAIGAGPGPMLARMAARGAAPGVTRAVPEGPDGVREFLADRPVGELPGIGRATARTLCEYGLDSLGKVAGAPLSTLQRLVGARAAASCATRRGASTAPGSYRTPRPARSPPNAPSPAMRWTPSGTAAPCSPAPRSWASGCAARTRCAAR